MLRTNVGAAICRPAMKTTKFALSYGEFAICYPAGG